MEKKQVYCALIMFGFVTSLHAETMEEQPQIKGSRGKPQQQPQQDPKFSKLISDFDQLRDEINQLSKLKPDIQKRIKEIEEKKREITSQLNENDNIINRLRDKTTVINQAINEYRNIEPELHDDAKAARQQKIEKLMNDIKSGIAQQQGKIDMLLKQSI